MSLERVWQQIERRIADHERGTRDGYEPAAEAHRYFLGAAREDHAAVKAAIERRALPVIATCGQCASFLDSQRERDDGWCEHEDMVGDDASARVTRSSAAPPSWCPLRGKR